MRRRLASLLAVSACLSLPALAMDPIPAEGGLSGFVNAGAGYVWIENSVIAGNRIVDLDNATIDSLGDVPEETGQGIPAMVFDLAYTFGTSGSQVSLGNELEDFLRFDAAAQLAYRKQFGEKDRISAGLLFTYPAAEVYADPYVVGTKREATTRRAPGVRLTWDRILGSPVEVDLTFRKIEIGNERSGATQLGLPASQRDLLDRNGRRAVVRVSYTFSRDRGAHVFIPSLLLMREDLDGKAVAGDAVEAQLTYKWNGRRLAVSSNILAVSRKSDEMNPIFGETMDHTALGASIQVFFKKFCGVEHLALLVAGARYSTHSNIDFYQAETSLASLGVFYKF